MGHVQYSFSNNLDNLSEGTLLYVTRSSYDCTWKSFPHSHHFSELFFVLNGEGYFCVEAERFPIRKESLFLINPHVRHTEISSADRPLEYIVLGIEGLSFLFDEHRRGYGIFFDAPSSPTPPLYLLRRMAQEMLEKRPYFEKACQSMLDLILIELIRGSNYELTLVPPKNISTECNMVKDYIDTHLQDNITLDLLAEVSHLNKFYLSHKFSEEFGISLINYLLEQRLQNGKKLLCNTDLRISMIAQLCGFSSQSYFTQTFRKSIGISPVRYREVIRQQSTISTKTT
jgi:AraC-like DNA-binding protein/mannose-6-phosphate isomerase-like protein (cupin superfamily)